MPKPHTTDAYERHYHQVHDPRYLIVKGNPLVQDSHMLMPLEDQKVLASLIRSIKPHQNNLTVEFSTKQFMDMLGLRHTHTNAQNIIGALNNILNDNFMMRNPDGTYDSIVWIAHIHADPRGKGYYRVDFMPNLREYLFNQSIKYRTIYKFSDIMLMQSQYSPRLYEIFRSNQSRQKVQKRGIDYTVKELKLALNLVHRDKAGKIKHDKHGNIKFKYPRFSDFRRRVLAPATNEINKNTEYNVKITAIRKKKTAVGVNVVMIKKNKHELRKRDDRMFFITHHIPKSQWSTWKENIERGKFHKVTPHKKHKLKTVNGKYKVVKPSQDSSSDSVESSLEKLDKHRNADEEKKINQMSKSELNKKLENYLNQHKIPFKEVNMGPNNIKYYNPWLDKYIWTTREVRDKQQKIYFKQQEYKEKQKKWVKHLKSEEKKRIQRHKS